MTTNCTEREARRPIRPRRTLAALGATLTLTLAGGASADAAPLSSALDPGSRITVPTTEGVRATAVDGDTLYVAGGIASVALRSPGLAVIDAGSGDLEREFPQLGGAAGDAGAASKIVPDGSGGAYALGVTRGADGIRQRGLLHVEPDGDVDTSFRPSFRDAAGDQTADVRDAALSADGRTLYVAGAFASVGGQRRPGLAALDAASGEVRAWAPQLGGSDPSVSQLAVAGDQLLIAGAFDALGGQARAGLGGVALADGAPTAWAPAGLDSGAAAVELLVDGTTAYLLAPRVVTSVTTTGPGTATDLGLAPSGDIRDALIFDGSLYLTGPFANIDGVRRVGLAEIDLATGRATSWYPGAPGVVVGRSLATDGDLLYVGLNVSGGSRGTAFGGVTRCGLAAVRLDAAAAVTSWNPRSVDFGGACQSPTSLAAIDGRVWAAGAFAAVNQQQRSGLAAVDLATDEILPWAPQPDSASIHDIAVAPDGETVYAVGAVGSVNGQPRGNAFAVAAGPGAGAADGSGDVRPWDPALDGTAYAIALDRSGDGQDVERVYLGGVFGSVDGNAGVPRLAAVAPDTGDAEPGWAPAPNADVTGLELSPDERTLYATGDFTTIGRTPAARNSVAAFADGGDTPTAWDPGLTGGSGAVRDVAVAGDVVYVGGSFDGTIGGQQRRFAAALRGTDGQALGWSPQPDATVATVSAASDGTVYLLGEFTRLGSATRERIASVGADGSVGGWAPQDFRPAEFTWSTEVREHAGRVIVPGYAFAPAFGGVPQNGLFGFGAASAPSVVERPGVTGIAREGEQLTCLPGSYGLDTYTLTYAWLRNGQAIAGAADGTYLVQASDRGTRVACRETAENAAGSVYGTSDELTIEVLRPTSQEPPEVFGDVRVGVVATCTTGTWSDFPTSHRFRWLLDGTPIAGATGRDHTPTAAQAGHGLACEVVAVNAAGESRPAASAARTVAAAPQGCTVDCPPPPCTSNCEPPPPPCTVGCGPPTPPSPGPDPVVGPPKPVPPAPDGRFTVPVKRASARGLSFTLQLPGAGAVSVAATARVGRRTIKVGSARASVGRAGAASVRLTLSRAARQALARARGRRLSVTVTFTFTPAGGSPTTVRQTLVVRAASRGAARRRARR